jgi:hypothetical protein
MFRIVATTDGSILHENVKALTVRALQNKLSWTEGGILWIDRVFYGAGFNG